MESSPHWRNANVLTTTQNLLLSACIVVLNIGQGSKCSLVAIAKIPRLLYTNNGSLSIHFISLAKFINKTPTQAFISGGLGIIHCSALGNPAPQFKWRRQDGRSLQDGRFIQLANGSLKVEPVRREDNGSYICTIKQSRGSESTSEKSQSINVMVIGKTREKHTLTLSTMQCKK